MRQLHVYGLFCYEAFTVADDLAWLLLEQALRERFVEFYGGSVPMVNMKTGDVLPIVGDNFDVVDSAFRLAGSHARGRWQLRLSNGGDMPFRGSMSQLLDWARREHLLDGQRNKRLDPVYVRMRNAVAHPRYHLSMPPDSARTISDLAEMINRLWGHHTPGGRLYPAPLERQVLVVAWTEADLGPTHTIVRDYLLPAFVERIASGLEEGDWSCVVVRAVYEDEGIWEFDAQYERSSFPADLLWGPGTPAQALAWIEEEKPGVDSVPYLDRLFAVRIHDDRASLARRPEVALALPPERRAGRWLLVRADFPLDAFAHGRHIKDGVTCGDRSTIVRQLQSGVTSTSPPIPRCAVEDVFDGDWEGMVETLGRRFSVTESAVLSNVRVRPRFSFGVARDVEAD